MSSINITLTSEQLAALLPAAKPAIDLFLPVLAKYSQAEFAAWVALAQRDTDAAQEELLTALAPEDLLAHMQDTLASSDATTQDIAQAKIDRKAMLAKAWDIFLVIAGGIITLAL